MLVRCPWHTLHITGVDIPHANHVSDWQKWPLWLGDGCTVEGDGGPALVICYRYVLPEPRHQLSSLLYIRKNVQVCLQLIFFWSSHLVNVIKQCHGLCLINVILFSLVQRFKYQHTAMFFIYWKQASSKPMTVTSLLKKMALSHRKVEVCSIF